MDKILIVDDQEDICRLLSITLGRDYEILQAKDGVSALKAVRQHHPKAVLLDIMMPGELDGLQVLTSIKSDPVLKHTLVAMVSARSQKEDVELGYSLGADTYITKPFSPLQLVHWVQTHLP